MPELYKRVSDVCLQYVSNFEENSEEQYVGKDGYNFRLEAARLALFRVEELAKARGDADEAAARVKQRDQYLRERDEISQAKRW